MPCNSLPAPDRWWPQRGSPHWQGCGWVPGAERALMVQVRQLSRCHHDCHCHLHHERGHHVRSQPNVAPAVSSLLLPGGWKSLQTGMGQGPFKKMALMLQGCLKEMSEAESAPECNVSCQSAFRPQTCKAHWRRPKKIYFVSFNCPFCFVNIKVAAYGLTARVALFFS